MASALRLAEAGFTVFAGVRKEADGVNLSGAATAGRIIPLLLDVTDTGQIDDAAAYISRTTQGAGLAALVNNAGTALAGPIELVPIEALRQQYEINVIGQMAVTKALLPLLRTGHGRIVNIGSAAGWITMPFGGVQCSAKHALRSLNDALRQELRPWSIPVILIEPGLINTAAVDKLEADVEPTLASFGPQGRARYEAAFLAMATRTLRHERERGASPDVVAEMVLRVLTGRRQRTRYPAGPAARSLVVLARLLPNPVLDALRYRILGLSPTAPTE
jgi:NAD(P)-dependent dehydrogenase (short-subunit alcohol dehydrogenase family)